MMIDEAIRHCGEVVKKQEELYRICPASESEMLHCNGTKDCRVLKNGKNKGCQKCAAEHRQLAEWLKELKSYRASVFSGDMTQKMLKEEYNKAIDDLVKEICKMIVQSENNGNYRFYAVEIKQAIADIAEQLKEGITND